MMADGGNNVESKTNLEDNPLTWLAAGAAALGAAWLGSKVFSGSSSDSSPDYGYRGQGYGGKMTYGRALKVLRDFNPMELQAPEKRAQLADAFHFFDMKDRWERGAPVDEGERRLSELASRLNTDFNSTESAKICGEFAAHEAREWKEHVRQLRAQGIDPASIERSRAVPEKVQCPLCRGLMTIQQRNYYGQLVSMPCPRCGATGFVLIGG
jgi:hypothetical protein